MRSILILFLALAAAPALAQDGDYVPLERRLTADQLRETGLDTLTPAQLERLNALLREDTAEVAREAEQRVRERSVGLREAEPRPEPVASSIVGAFRGWSGGQMLTLANGQQWRVLDSPPLYLRRPLQDPKVTIAPGFLGAWYLSVDGQAPKAKVKRVK